MAFWGTPCGWSAGKERWGPGCAEGRGQLVAAEVCREGPGQRGKVSPLGSLTDGCGKGWGKVGQGGNSPGKYGSGWDGEVGSRVHPILRKLCTFAKIWRREKRRKWSYVSLLLQCCFFSKFTPSIILKVISLIFCCMKYTLF